MGDQQQNRKLVPQDTDPRVVHRHLRAFLEQGEEALFHTALLHRLHGVWFDRNLLLRTAVEFNRVSSVGLLIRLGADDFWGALPLTGATGSRELFGRLLRLIKNSSQNPQGVSRPGERPTTRERHDHLLVFNETLLQAARGGHQSFVRELIEDHGATDIGGALVTAVRFGHRSLVRYLVQINPSADSLIKAFVEAIRSHRIRIAEILLDRGNIQDPEEGIITLRAHLGGDEESITWAFEAAIENHVLDPPLLELLRGLQEIDFNAEETLGRHGTVAIFELVRSVYLIHNGLVFEGAAHTNNAPLMNHLWGGADVHYDAAFYQAAAGGHIQLMYELYGRIPTVTRNGLGFQRSALNFVITEDREEAFDFLMALGFTRPNLRESLEGGFLYRLLHIYEQWVGNRALELDRWRLAHPTLVGALGPNFVLVDPEGPEGDVFEGPAPDDGDIVMGE